MIFREATQADMDYVAEHSISQGVQSKQPESIDYLFTLEHEDVPLGIGGFRLLNSTTAWAWVNLADTSHMITGYRVIKNWIESFVEEHKLRRLQAYVMCDFPEAIRMVKHLGFRQESIMRCFNGDKSAYLYVRIF